jgi:GH25 family lysozyme M1 (1,4-beta-N-acetylmuramidase)
VTTYGFDIAHYQSGIPIGRARDQGYSFCMAKVTEGTTYVDPTFGGFRDAAKAEKLLFAGYHFLRSDSDGAAQGRFCVSKLGDKSIPIMIDVESEGSSHPQISHIRGFINGVRDAGGNVSLMYVPHWYWEQHMGSPNLTGLPRLVASNYVTGHDYASKLYPGDNSAKWFAYGGQMPTILQFSSSVAYSGYGGTIDGDAFVGSETDLKKLNLFKDYTGVSALRVHTYQSLNGLSIAVLHYGDNDKDFQNYHMVERLQKLLGATPDGIYGNETASKVAAYLGKGNDGKTVDLNDWSVIYGLKS